jgi:hypothetical protein
VHSFTELLRWRGGCEPHPRLGSPEESQRSRAGSWQVCACPRKIEPAARRACRWSGRSIQVWACDNRQCPCQRLARGDAGYRRCAG